MVVMRAVLWGIREEYGWRNTRFNAHLTKVFGRQLVTPAAGLGDNDDGGCIHPAEMIGSLANGCRSSHLGFGRRSDR